MGKIKVNIIKSCALLDINSFGMLRSFTSELSTYLKNNTIDFGLFAKISKSKLGLEEDKLLLKYSESCSESNINVLDLVGYYIINEYSDILSVLLNNNALIDFMLEIDKTEDLFKIMDYICSNNKNKKHYLHCLNKLLEIGVEEISFDPNYHFTGIYNVEKKDGVLSMIYSDGKKEWLSQDDPNIYQFKLIGGNYFMKCNCGIVEMDVKNLDFDISTLPSRNDVRKPNVFTSIDYESVSTKTMAVNCIYKMEQLLESTDCLFQEYDFLDELPIENGGHHTNVSITSELKDMKEALIKKYFKLGIMDENELEISLYKRKKYCLQNKK